MKPSVISDSIVYDVLTYNYTITTTVNGDAMISVEWMVKGEEHTLSIIRGGINFYVVHTINGYTYKIKGFKTADEARNSESILMMVYAHMLGFIP